MCNRTSAYSGRGSLQPTPISVLKLTKNEVDASAMSLAIKVDPHSRAGLGGINGEVPPIPRHVEGQVAVLLVVVR